MKSVAYALLLAMFVSATPAGAAPRAFLFSIDAPGGSGSASASSADGLAVTRIFDSSGDGDIVSFSDGPSDATPVGGSIFGFSMTLPLRASEKTFAPRIFAESSRETQAAGPLGLSPGASGQTVGMQFDLLGGVEASVAMQSTGASFGSGPFAANPSQSPAVFAFYNFPQARSGFSFGAPGPAPLDVAAASPLSVVRQTAPLTASALSSPLISSLSARGPFWYSAYSPATRGSSLSISIPFQLARIPVSVRLGEQTLANVQSSSLANQILGPAFASSAGAKYSAVTGGVSLALPVLSRRATVSLDGWYETLRQGDQTPFSLTPNASQPAAGVGAAVQSPVIYTPANARVQQYVGAASLALPVTSRLTVNGSFSEQVSGAVALDALTQDLTQHKTGIGGGVAYSFPKTNSSIEFFSNRSVSTDDNIPNYNFTESRQNLYFSVKF